MNERKSGKSHQIEDIYALSPMQDGMLFHSLYAPESSAYFIQSRSVLQGPLDVGAFKRAWQSVLDRHAVLRSSFHWKEVERPVQVVHKEVAAEWEERDWRNMPSSDHQEQVKVWLEADRNRGFDLSVAPLMRMALIRLSGEQYEFIWTLHHILVDAWSVRLTFAEVLSFYEAYFRGEELMLPKARPYGDYIAWLQDQSLTNAENYWKRRLKGFALATPLTVNRPTESASEGGEHYKEQRLDLSEFTTAALQFTGRQHQLTLNTIVQGAWAILLSRYSQQKDVVFGTVVSGRSADIEGVENMVGPFINTLPARVTVRDQEKVLDWLKKLQAEQVEARDYEYSPLAQVQKWSDVPRGATLFETIFAFNSFPARQTTEEPQTSLRVRHAPSFEKSNYPLAVEAAVGQHVSINIGYDTRQFDDQTIDRMRGHLNMLLEGVAANPAQSLSEIALLTPAERLRVEQDWNATETIYPRDACVPELFEAQAEALPYSIAAAFGDERITYAELNERANQVAAFLRLHRVGPEVVVGICVERSLEMLIGILGILKSGGAYLPLDPAYPRDRLSFMLEDTGVKLLLTQKSLVDRLPLHNTRAVCLDADWHLIAGMSAENVRSNLTPENVAYIMYTSGSTGRPKGICIPHRGIVRLVLNTNYIDLKPDDVLGQGSSFSFDAATFEIWGALLNGARLVIIDKEISLSPKALARQISREHINVLFLTTALFNQMAGAAPEAFALLRCLMFGGENVDPRWPALIVGHAPRLRLLHVYGPTESTTYASWYPVDSVPESATTVPIGFPLANTQMYLLDENLSPVPVYVPGEIYIGGDGLARGYLNRPDLTAERFVPAPFKTAGARLYKTGDVGRYLPDGSIEFIGRIDSQIKIRGFRIEPGEIEAALLQHPSIKEAIVAPWEEGGDRRLVAYLVRGDAPEITISQLRDFLNEKLPVYMIPAHFQFLESLPLNENGKVDRQALPAPDKTRHDLGSRYLAPRDQLESDLVELWADVLDVRPVGIRDNFFELGGDSLLAVRLLSRIQAKFGYELPLAILFQQSNVESLAEALQQHEILPRSTLVSIQPEGSLPPLFCVHPGSGNVMCYAPLARYLGDDQPLFGIQDPRLQGDPLMQKSGDFDLPLEMMAAEYLEAMQVVQATGPYYLLGWSFGSHVAFEMAQRLTRDGHEVRLLAMLDSGAPPVISQLTRVMDDAELLTTIARELGLQVTSAELRASAPSARLTIVAKQLVTQGLASEDRAFAWIERELEIFKARLRVVGNYKAQPYAGRISLFRASELDAEDIKFLDTEDGQRVRHLYHDPTMGWTQFSTQDVDVQFVPGNHATMAREPHVKVLAQQIAVRLSQSISSAMHS